MLPLTRSEPTGSTPTVAEPRHPVSRRSLLALDFGQAPARAGYWIRLHRRAMACRFEVTLSGEDAGHVAAAREALDDLERIEDALTIFRETSELVQVNRHAAREPVSVGHDLFGLLRLCRTLNLETEGAFDPTTAPLSRCWGFLRHEARLPSDGEIQAALAITSMDGVALDDERRTVRFHRAGIELNLGGIGKGFALDRLVALLRERGARHALLSAGGSSVLALGGRDRGFVIDLRSRRGLRDRLARLHLRDGALGTSGAGEQFAEVEGRRYGHVLDPRTGWPASGVLSASVVAAEAAVADALSTAFLVGGVDLARRYCESHPNVLTLVTPDDGSERPAVFGSFAGAIVEAGS